jgi:hypothetical protein
MATSGDFLLATNGDFLMATDSIRASAHAVRVRATEECTTDTPLILNAQIQLGLSSRMRDGGRTHFGQISHPGRRIGDRHPGVRHRVDNRLPEARLLGDFVENKPGG